MRLFILIWCCIPAVTVAQFSTARIFSSNMLLQRNAPVPVWGKGIPGNTVVVKMGSESREVTVQQDSSWMVRLAPRPASKDPHTLSISCGDTTVSFSNIIFGDNWICIGQSNMEWPLKREMHFDAESHQLNQPLIRIYNPSYAGKNIFGTLFTDSVTNLLRTTSFYTGSWQVADSNSAVNMSAVAWYFGRKLTTELNVPVGLINLSIGGAPLETFIDAAVLKNSGSFSAKMNGNWLQNDALPEWVRERATQNTGASSTVPADSNGKNHAFKPGFAFAAGIKQLLPMPVKGILCYQGESNAQELPCVMEYAELFTLLVNNYRTSWQQPELPFYFVQLSSIDTVNYKGKLWPLFRDQQRLLQAQLPNSGMAVCSDIGFRNDVHPTNKKEVGERLARLALYHSYKKKIIPSGPLPLKAKYKQGKLLISFKYVAGRLKTAAGNTLSGFSLDGVHDIPAVIRNKRVIILLKEKPAYVHYGWKPFSDGNLVNGADLPASTFRLKVL